MQLLWIISFCLLASYLFLILASLAGWFRSIGSTGSGPAGQGISVVIPVRNEEGNIRQLLSDLAGQDHPADQLEILVVDDHSEDGTMEAARSFLGSLPGLRLMELDEHSGGKKEALKKGANAAKHPVILNTDGDCRAPGSWVSSMAAMMAEEQIRMVVGPVVLEPDSGCFYGMQSLEFFSLTAITAGFAGLRSPVMCNAANLAYYRDDYIQFTREHPKRSESGDDVFLMLWLKKKFPGTIRYNGSQGSVIRTHPERTPAGFIGQRMRWASKGKYYRDAQVLVTGGIVWALNALMLVLLLAAGISPVAGHWDPGLLFQFLLLYACKSLADLLILWPVLGHFGKTGLLKYFIPLEIIYFVYSSLVGAISQFTGYRWKDRKIRT